MSLHSQIVANSHSASISLPAVEAEMNYLVPMREKPHNYTFEPPPGVPRTNAVYAPHRVAIHDARPLAPGLSLDREGFALIEHDTELSDFYDEDSLRRVYYPEAERIVAEATGADRVVIFDHTIRKRVPGLEDRTQPGPRQ